MSSVSALCPHCLDGGGDGVCQASRIPLDVIENFKKEYEEGEESEVLRRYFTRTSVTASTFVATQREGILEKDNEMFDNDLSLMFKFKDVAICSIAAKNLANKDLPSLARILEPDDGQRKEPKVALVAKQEEERPTGDAIGSFSARSTKAPSDTLSFISRPAAKTVISIEEGSPSDPLLPRSSAEGGGSGSTSSWNCCW